jgi:O-antigen ligase
MTTRIWSRFAPSRIVSTAIAETRLAARAVPDVVRFLAPIVIWATVAIVLGAIVGLAAFALPPLGAFGIVAVFAVLLLWVMPEVPVVFPRVIRATFFIMLIVNLCVPYYYMVQFGDLPWISVRRVAAFALIAPFLLAVSGSSEVRRQIATRLRPSLPILICAVGYLVMAVLSLPQSPLRGDSTSALVDALLEWYVPFFAAIYVLADERDIVLFLKIICFCAVFNSVSGIVEYRLEHRFFTDIFPKGMLASLAQSNPMLWVLIDGQGGFRNGAFRATSTFLVPLSFGEFEIIVIPIGLFFALHREKLLEKCLGWTVLITGFLAILASGSRGSYVGFLASIGVFAAIWPIRKSFTHRGTLAPGFIGTLNAIILTVVFFMVMFVPRVHGMVFGGAGQAGSTQARWDQWAAARPLVMQNPITGHGFVTGGFDIGSSIDSYVISLLVETGVPGFLFFSAMVLLPIWYGVRHYLTDLTQSGALAGALACSFVAFSFYRLVLSQRENHFLIYCLLGAVVMVNYVYQGKVAKQPRRVGAQRRSYSRPGEQGLKTA